MRCIPTTALAAMLAWAVTGCQHYPREPLDLPSIAGALENRELDIEPIREYAEMLAPPPAAPFDAEDGITLAEGQAIALWYNAGLRVRRLEAVKAGAIEEGSGRWDDPTLEWSGGEKRTEEDPAGFLHDAGNVTRSWISSTSLAITLPLSGRPQAQKRAATAELIAARARVAEAEWILMGQVRDAWIQWSAAREEAKLLENHAALMAPFVEASRALADAGEILPSSASLFSIEQLRLEAQLTRVRAKDAGERIALLGHLGLSPEAPVELAPQTAPPQIPEVFPPLDSHPALVARKAEYDAVEERLQLELRRQYPDLVLSPTRVAEDNESSITLGFGLPLPVWNANRAPIAEAAAQRDIARARVEEEYQRLQVQIAAARALHSGMREQRSKLLDEVVPAVDAQTEQTVALLRAGEIDLTLLFEVLRQALNTKQEVIEASIAEALAASRVLNAAGEGALDVDLTREGGSDEQ